MLPAYRTATMKDLEALRELGLNTYGQFKPVLTDKDWNRLRAVVSAGDTYTKLLAVGTGFVCEEDDTLIGMAFLVPHGNPTEIFRAEWSHIRMVGVHTGHGGKGIGKKLTQLCIDHARTTGEKTIALHTSEFMDAARHIYESLGFRQVQEIAPRFGKKYWLYRLELEP